MKEIKESSDDDTTDDDWILQHSRSVNNPEKIIKKGGLQQKEVENKISKIGSTVKTDLAT